MKPSDVLKMVKAEGVEVIDMQFGDLFGTMHHFSFPVKLLEESTFEEGISFDGSSIRAWQSIDKSDMLIKPDPRSAFIDPFREMKTLVLFNDVFDPRTGERYGKDPPFLGLESLRLYEINWNRRRLLCWSGA